VPDGRQPTSHKDQRRHSAPLAVQEMVFAMLLIAKGLQPVCRGGAEVAHRLTEHCVGDVDTTQSSA
jgi:hypothetical protein